MKTIYNVKIEASSDNQTEKEIYHFENANEAIIFVKALIIFIEMQANYNFDTFKCPGVPSLQEIDESSFCLNAEGEDEESGFAFGLVGVEFKNEQNGNSVNYSIALSKFNTM